MGKNDTAASLVRSDALLAAASYLDGRAAHLSNHATGYTRGDIERLHIGILIDLAQACKHAAQAANAGGEGREPCERTSPPPCSAPLVAQPPRDVSELYHELLYAVARKFPGESRHETALRYIRDTEERVCEAGSCKQNDQAEGAT